MKLSYLVSYLEATEVTDNSMRQFKKDVILLLTHWGYVFCALIHPIEITTLTSLKHTVEMHYTFFEC